MALPSHSEWKLMDESSLKDWEQKAEGGFGHIFKARHIEWGWDVAIKVLHQYDGSRQLLLREAELMREGGSNFVIRVQGVFRGQVPTFLSIQDGLVMEFMDRGSLASLQDTLNNPPQKPLVFRMAHQVALGMNYLHCLTPPLLHLDLHPGNVLLDKDLNVKITDFGLSKIYSSMTSKRSGLQPGTLKYMPPEALTNIEYKAIGAYDVYSYGILLWSIVMWKEPYEGVIPARILLLIPKNQRPSVKEMNPEDKLTELMQKCWNQEPNQRPPFRECIGVTEVLCKDKEHEIDDAVHQVQKELAQQEDEITQPSASSNGKSRTASSRMLTEPPVIQDVVDGLTSTESAAGTVSPNGEPSRVITAQQQQQQEGRSADKKQLYHYKDAVNPSDKPAWVKEDAVGLTDKEKADFVMQHRAKLIQKVTTVMAIVESLGSDVVHPEISAAIRAQNLTIEQMRILYEKVIVPSGTAIRAAFYDALEEQHYLGNRLSE